MSQENVEVVRRSINAWNDGGPESARRTWAKDIEWHDPPNIPDPRVVRGQDSVPAYLTDQASVIGDLKLTPVKVRTSGEAVVVRMELTIHGAESGVEVPGEMAQLVDVADGRVQRVRVFRTWAEALEAAGLEE